MSPDDFFSHYLTYTNGGEVPTSFHRWSAIAGIAAILERNIYLPFGHTEIHPNIYTMLIGSAGTRKSSAIRLMKKLLIKAGYTTIAAERSSKERFLYDLSHKSHESSEKTEDILDQNLFGAFDLGVKDESDATPMLIAADEANDFFGINNVDFLSILGNLWDWSGKYENRIKTGKSDWIPNPTITILSGNTPTGFNQAFPSALFGQGFFSRLLIIYGEPNGKRITIPRAPSAAETEHIVNLLQAVRVSQKGMREFTPQAFKLLDAIYQSTGLPTDSKLDAYYNRRAVHLCKLCLVVSAARLESKISEVSVIQANTYLTYVEGLMSKALGEFGSAKNSDAAHKILTFLRAQDSPASLKDIWKQVNNELDKMSDLQQIVQKLIFADKIQTVVANGHSGFLPIRKAASEIDPVRAGFVSYGDFLTPEELEVRV